jgi:hypothetical protein
VNSPRELIYFLMLPRNEQIAAIKRLAAAGQSEQTIAAATKLSVEQIRELLSEEKESG